MSPPATQMRVSKRDGSSEAVSFDKVLQRLGKLCGEFPVSEPSGESDAVADAVAGADAGGRGARLTPLPNVDVVWVSQRVIAQLHDGVSTSKLDEHAAELCASLASRHPDYGALASRLAVNRCHKATPPSFAAAVRRLGGNLDRRGAPSPLLSDELLGLCAEGSAAGDGAGDGAGTLARVEAAIDYSRDYLLDYFGFRTLEKGYLLRDSRGRTVERPQHMWMRVALGIHGLGEGLEAGEGRLKDALETYEHLSLLRFTHATPTLYNAGTRRPQLSSCFLMATREDSLEGIYATLTDCARVSKWAGGIGLSMHDVRAAGSLIRGTNGDSAGLVPLLRVFNNSARYVDQGGRRLGSIAIYLEPWHSDVREWLALRRNQGAEEERARDLFYALWTPDLFMRRVRAGADWSLLCPDECPGLSEVHGAEFDALYERYEAEGKARATVKADALWREVVRSQVETGNPYVLFKDACNRKSNQNHLGTIKSSNLCAEVVQFSSPEETAVCTLGSLCLPSFVAASADVPALPRGRGLSDQGAAYGGDAYGGDAAKAYDFGALSRATARLVRNLDRVIDRTFYPLPQARRSNLLHRPMGVGVQGLADVFAMLGLPFESEGARALNSHIFETIYRAAVLASCDLARERAELAARCVAALGRGDDDEHDRLREELAPSELDNPTTPLLAEEGAPPARWPGAHPSFEGSPASRGLLQHDLWDAEAADKAAAADNAAAGPPPNARSPNTAAAPPCLMYADWPEIRDRVRRHGMRNSLLTAAMPTASTASIMGNTESFEAFGPMLMSRKTLAGSFVLINKHLVAALGARGLWGEAMRDRIVGALGSVQGVEGVPPDLQEVFKTVWEVRQRAVVDLAADRGRFIDQSASMNLHFAEADIGRITNAIFYGWERGLKTGVYYTRVKPRSHAQQFSLQPKAAGGPSLPQQQPTGDDGAAMERVAQEVYACSLRGGACDACSA